MEENNNVTNLGNNIGYSATINTQPVQPQLIQAEPQQIPNNIQEQPIATPLTTDNVVTTTSVENTNMNYTNLYNQQVFESIKNNVVSETQITQADIQAQAQAVQQTQTVVNPTQNITIGSPTAQQMAQADVVQTTVSAPITSNLTQNITVTEQPVTTEVKLDEEIKEDVKQESEQPVINDKYVLKTEKLKQLLNNAKKIAVNEGLLPTTTIFQLVFGEDAFKVIATDSMNILVQTDKSVKFTNPTVISLKSELTYNLISKLASEYIELQYNDDDTITVISDTSTFILQQQLDPNTFKPITIETSGIEILPTDTIYTLDINDFKNRVNNAYKFVLNPKILRKLSGVYCGQGYILATDSSNIIGSDNLPELANESMYLNERFLKIFTQLDYIGDTKIAIRKDNEGKFAGIIVFNDDMVLGGPAHKSQDDFEIMLNDRILPAFSNRSYDNTYLTFNKSQFSYMLTLSELFVDTALDKDSCKFIIKGNNLCIQSISKTAKQELIVTNNNVPDMEFNLKVIDTINALENCGDTEIQMQVDVQEKSAIILNTPGLKQVITTITL